MKTFNEFIEYKKIEKLIDEAAELMVELDVDPAQYILSYVSNDPKVETALLEYIQTNEGFMDTLGRVGKAAGQFLGNVWKGGGVTGGWKQGTDTIMGPKAKFDTAKKVLSDLVSSLANNDQTKGMMADTKSGTVLLTQYLQKVIDQLTKQEKMIPVMTPQANTQPQMKQNP